MSSKRKYVKSGKYTATAKRMRAGMKTLKQTFADRVNHSKLVQPATTQAFDLSEFMAKARKVSTVADDKAETVRKVTVQLIEVKNFQDCPRCGQVHPKLVFKPIKRPIQLADGSAPQDYWCQCPKTGSPILAALEDMPFESQKELDQREIDRIDDRIERELDAERMRRRVESVERAKRAEAYRAQWDAIMAANHARPVTNRSVIQDRMRRAMQSAQATKPHKCKCGKH